MDTDIYYGAGSDDFRGYVWKLPPVTELVEKRIEMTQKEWLATASPETVGWCSFFTRRSSHY